MSKPDRRTKNPLPLGMGSLNCGAIAASIASSRYGSPLLWFFIGLVFGPLGLAFSFLSGSERSCSACKKRVHPGATKCPYCQSVIPQDSKVATPTENPNVAPTESSKAGWIMVGALVVLFLVIFGYSWHVTQ